MSPVHTETDRRLLELMINMYGLPAVLLSLAIAARREGCYDEEVGILADARRKVLEFRCRQTDPRD